MTTDTTASAPSAFASFLLWRFGTKPEDYEPTATPGYWRRKVACGGRGECPSPLHGFMFNEGPIHHTVQFLDPIDRDEKGRFLPRYETWKAARAAEPETRA